MSPILANTVVFPSGADFTNAYTQQIGIEAQQTDIFSNHFFATPPGFYMLPLVVYFEASTTVSQTVNVPVTLWDEEDRTIYTVTSPTSQPPSTTYNYCFSSELPSFSAAAAGVTTTTLPLVPLLPGFHLYLGGTAVGGNLVLTFGMNITALLVPSGASTVSPADLTATIPAPPILV